MSHTANARHYNSRLNIVVSGQPLGDTIDLSARPALGDKLYLSARPALGDKIYLSARPALGDKTDLSARPALGLYRALYGHIMPHKSL